MWKRTCGATSRRVRNVLSRPLGFVPLRGLRRCTGILESLLSTRPGILGDVALIAFGIAVGATLTFGVTFATLVKVRELQITALVEQVRPVPPAPLDDRERFTVRDPNAAPPVPRARP